MAQRAQAFLHAETDTRRGPQLAARQRTACPHCGVPKTLFAFTITDPSAVPPEQRSWCRNCRHHAKPATLATERVDPAAGVQFAPELEAAIGGRVRALVRGLASEILRNDLEAVVRRVVREEVARALGAPAAEARKEPGDQ